MAKGDGLAPLLTVEWRDLRGLVGRGAKAKEGPLSLLPPFRHRHSTAAV